MTSHFKVHIETGCHRVRQFLKQTNFDRYLISGKDKLFSHIVVSLIVFVSVQISKKYRLFIVCIFYCMRESQVKLDGDECALSLSLSLSLSLLTVSTQNTNSRVRKGHSF